MAYAHHHHHPPLDPTVIRVRVVPNQPQPPPQPPPPLAHIHQVQPPAAELLFELQLSVFSTLFSPTATSPPRRILSIRGPGLVQWAWPKLPGLAQIAAVLTGLAMVRWAPFLEILMSLVIGVMLAVPRWCVMSAWWEMGGAWLRVHRPRA